MDYERDTKSVGGIRISHAIEMEGESPIIQVRTWQPDRNPDLTPNLPKSSRDYGIFSTASFN